MGRLGVRRFASAIAVVAACTAAFNPSASAGPLSATSIPSLPNSMAAIGDSFTAGFATGTQSCEPWFPTKACSWSTGTGVNSHYERILAQNPAISGQTFNVAWPGQPMGGFLSQANSAAANHPDYVTVMLGAGDICFTDIPTVTFRGQFRAGMDAFTAASPSSKVLVASVWNFESFRQAMLDAGAVGPWGPGWCGAFFDQPDAVRAAKMAQVVDYNTALAEECATYTNCRFDANALYNHVWTVAEVNPGDKLHPSVAGQEMISEVLWNAGFWGAPAPSHPSCRAKDAASQGATASGKAVPVPCS